MNKFCSKKIYSPVLSRCRDNQKARTFLVIKGLQSLSIIKQALAESSYCFPNHECIPSSKHFAAHFEPQMANSTQTKVARPLFLYRPPSANIIETADDSRHSSHGWYNYSDQRNIGWTVLK